MYGSSPHGKDARSLFRRNPLAQAKNTPPQKPPKKGKKKREGGGGPGPGGGAGPIRSTPSNGTSAPPPSRAKTARSSSSRPTAKFPSFWSQLATNVVVSKYFYGEVGTPEREHSVRQLIHRVGRTIADWGIEDGYFATREDGERFYRELAWLCLHQHGAFNSPVWFNVGLFHQYGVKGAQCNWHWDRKAKPSRFRKTRTNIRKARPASSKASNDNMEDIMELARSEAMLFKFGSGHRHRPVDAPLASRKALRRRQALAARCRSCGSTTRSPPSSRAAARPAAPPRCNRSRSGTPTSWSSSSARPRKRRRPALLIEKGGYDESNFNGEAYSSIMFQNANLSVRVTDDFMQAVDREQALDHALGHRPEAARPDLPGPRNHGPHGRVRLAAAAIRACSTTRRSTAGTPARTGPHQRQQSVQRVHVPRRHGLQPGQHQPDEVPPEPDGTFDVERFQAACRIFFIAQEILVDHASYPTKRIARQQPPVPPAGPGLLEPRQPDHGQRACRTIPTRPAAVRRDHRPAARCGQPDQQPSWPRPSARSTATRRTASRCSA